MAVKTIKLNVTAKEAEVAKLLADGNTVPEIAAKLNINLRTLEATIFSLKLKYNSNTLAALVATFLRNKLID